MDEGREESTKGKGRDEGKKGRRKVGREGGKGELKEEERTRERSPKVRYARETNNLIKRKHILATRLHPSAYVLWMIRHAMSGL